jgi:hypothetical protein
MREFKKMPQILSYEDKKFNRTKQIYDMLAQSFQDIKHEINGKHGWNKPVNDLDGITFRMAGSDIEITYHRYEVTTREGLVRGEGQGFKFIDEVEKELKKKFKELTKKVLKLKKINENEGIEKTSMLQSDRSSLLGYGYGNRMYGRFLVKSSRVYEVNTKL